MPIAKLWSRGEEAPARPAARVPDGARVYAIGDIHGQLDQLRALEDLIVADAAEHPAERRTIVYLGDYVDRGQDSAGAVGHLVDGPPAGFDAVYLMGNHEALMLDFLEDPDGGANWLMNGGDTTLEDYGVEVHETDAVDGSRLQQLSRRFRQAMPRSHRSFLERLALSHVEGDYLFVHAGVRPDVPLDEQDPHDLVWIRYPFLQSSADFGKLVVHGHTPESHPVERDNRIGIDTGAVYGGRLTALVLDGDIRRFLQV